MSERLRVSLRKYLDNLEEAELQYAGEVLQFLQAWIKAPREDAGQPVAGHPELPSNVPNVAPAEEPLGPATTEYLKATARRVSARTWAALREDGGEAGLPEPGLADLLRSARFRPRGAKSFPASRTERFLCMDLCHRCSRARRDLFWTLLGEEFPGIRLSDDGSWTPRVAGEDTGSPGAAPGVGAAPVRGGGGK